MKEKLTLAQTWTINEFLREKTHFTTASEALLVRLVHTQKIMLPDLLENQLFSQNCVFIRMRFFVDLPSL